MLVFTLPFAVVRGVFGFVLLSSLVWVFISTIIPQLQTSSVQHSISNIPNTLINKSIYFVIAHPDDEVMFFSPSIIELSKLQYNNKLNLICFSNGDAENLGEIRASELTKSGRILGFDNQNIHLLNDAKFVDGMNVSWDASDIDKTLTKIIRSKRDRSPKTFITFDEEGVSNHTNHRALYVGVKEYTAKKNEQLYVLKTQPIWKKYSFTVLTNMEILKDFFTNYHRFNHHLANLYVDHVRDRLADWNSKINIAPVNRIIHQLLIKLDYHLVQQHVDVAVPLTSQKVRVFNDLNSLFVSLASMGFGHFSQMVWFRYGWLFSSSYLTFNELIESN